LAQLALGFAHKAGRTVLARKRQFGPLAVQRPFYPEGDVCHLYLLHPPGGVVGGDRVEIDLEVEGGARALVTAPGATKLYRSAGAYAIVQQRLKVARGGQLEWFPRESILFPGAKVRLSTRVELAGDARFIGWELQGLGRPVIGERFDAGVADLGFSVYRDGRPVLLDRLRVQGEQDLDGPCVLRGYPVCGTLIATGADSADLDAAREALSVQTDLPVGLTLVADMLIARGLGPTIEPLNRIFVTLWSILRPRLVGYDACPPRIWAT
jgi:urease accessory protein